MQNQKPSKILRVIEQIVVCYWENLNVLTFDNFLMTHKAIVYEPLSNISPGPSVLMTHLNFKASWYNTGDETEAQLLSTLPGPFWNCGGLLNISCSWSWQSWQEQAVIQTRSPSFGWQTTKTTEHKRWNFPGISCWQKGSEVQDNHEGNLVSQKDEQFSHQHAGDNGEPSGVSDE